jgi:hypothetical protein
MTELMSTQLTAIARTAGVKRTLRWTTARIQHHLFALIEGRVKDDDRFVLYNTLHGPA